MNFKELFDREFCITEEKSKRALKIFYEIDLKLLKPEEKPNPPIEQPVAPPVENNPPANPPVEQQPPVEQPVVPPAENNPPAENKPDLSGALASIQTEEENTVIQNNENQTVLHLNGEYKCEKEEASNIQSFDDLVDIIGKVKSNGVNLLDDFAKEIIILCANQNFQKIQQDLDKKSKIFVEIYFGYKKQDSIGIRFKKNESSDNLTSVVLVNDQIVPMLKFDINKVNKKILEYRNYEVEKA